ncbi:hypothetical protein HY413_02020 [Candidatus Kaiserbacteria bacterium]|nr:hypothetical protein [Candidatus Kaiserbacteria bacterium]
MDPWDVKEDETDEPRKRGVDGAEFDVEGDEDEDDAVDGMEGEEDDE